MEDISILITNRTTVLLCKVRQGNSKDSSDSRKTQGIPMGLKGLWEDSRDSGLKQNINPNAKKQRIEATGTLGTNVM